MRAQRHIRCPRCNREGHLPEGYAKARVRCPNPGCHHVFALPPVGGLAAEAEGYDRELAAAIWEVTTRGDKTAPELDGDLLADVDSPARPRVGAPTQPPPAAPAARPRSADTETRPDRGPEPSVVRGPEPEIAGRRRWWVVATVGGLTLAVLLFGIGAWVIRPDNDKKTLRDSEPLAGVATRLPAGPGGARDETGLAPEPPAAAPIAKAVPPADQVADGGTDRGGPAKDVPGEDVPEAKAVPPVEQTAPAPPADPPIGDPGRSSDATAEPTAVKHLRPGDDDRGFHAERRRAEAVLLEAGLKRVSNSYILPEEVEAGNLATAIAKRQAELEKLMRKYRDLEWQYNASRASHSQRMSEAARMGNESSVSQSLSQEESRHRGEIRKLEEEIAPVQREIEDDQMRYRMIETRTLPQYAELAARPEIQTALRVLNKGTQPKVALGPIPAYRQNVLKQMVAILTALDLEPDPKFRGLCCLKADAEFITRVNDAINLQRALAQDEAQLWPSGVAAASTAAAYRTPPAPAAVAAQRADFVRLVRALREQADALRARHQQLAEDIEVKDALAVIDDEYARTATRKAGRPKARFGPKFRIPQAFKDVDAMAAMIRTERIPLDAVAEGPRVVVVLNGKSVPGVALDLEAEPVVLPSRLAAELGVAPAAGAPLVPLARAGGRTLSARPATIASVRIGPFEVNDVACLIPAEETDEAFPVLGASVLGRFVTTLDPKAGILTLTRVSFRGMATIRDKMGH